MIDFADVKSGEQETRDLTDFERKSFRESMDGKAMRAHWAKSSTEIEASILDIGGVFDEVAYYGITSVNALVVEGARNFEAVSLDEVKKVVDRICAAREVLRNRGYVEEEYPERNGEYTYEFARRTPREELAKELDYLLNRFSTELEAALNLKEIPVQ